MLASFRKGLLAVITSEADATIPLQRSSKPSRYQVSFKPNCTCRAVVEVEVITPAEPETPGGVKVIRLGVLKFARFSRLKISARNCRLNRSRSCVFLMAEKSHVAKPGPVKPLREALPQNPLLAGGCRNTAGLNHRFGDPTIGFPLKLGLLNGRTGLRVSPLLDGL